MKSAARLPGGGSVKHRLHDVSCPLAEISKCFSAIACRVGAIGLAPSCGCQPISNTYAILVYRRRFKCRGQSLVMHACRIIYRLKQGAVLSSIEAFGVACSATTVCVHVLEFGGTKSKAPASVGAWSSKLRSGSFPPIHIHLVEICRLVGVSHTKCGT